VICPDVNLLVYAHLEVFSEHAAAAKWWQGVLASPTTVGLCHVVVLGFIRLSTNRKLFPIPISLEDAVSVVDSWLAQPNVRLLPPAESHWDVLKVMLRAGRAGSNLTTDAHIAAIASEHSMA